MFAAKKMISREICDVKKESNIHEVAVHYLFIYWYSLGLRGIISDVLEIFFYLRPIHDVIKSLNCIIF